MIKRVESPRVQIFKTTDQVKSNKIKDAPSNVLHI